MMDRKKDEVTWGKSISLHKRTYFTILYIHACNSFRLFSEKQGPEDEGVYRNWLKWEGTDHNTPLDQSPCSQWNGVWGGDVSSPLYRFIVVLHSCMYLFSTISGIRQTTAIDGPYMYSCWLTCRYIHCLADGAYVCSALWWLRHEQCLLLKLELESCPKWRKNLFVFFF